MRSIAFAALLAMSGCAHAQRDGRETAGSEGRSSVASAATPQSGPHEADTYTTEVPAGSSVAGEAGVDTNALARRLVAACRAAGLQPDPRLASFALELARNSQGTQRMPRGSYLSYLGQHLGLIEPGPQPWLGAASQLELLLPALDSSVAQMARTIPLTHCGGAQVVRGDMVVVAVAVSGRFVELTSPLPRRVPVPATVQLAAKLASGYSRPALAITGPDGSTRRLALPASRTIRQSLTFERPGAHTLEILAEGPAGMVVIGIASILAGDVPEPEPPPYEEDAAETDPASVQKKLVRLINDSRKQQGLAPVSVDVRLERVALAHSEDMDAHHFVAHVSKTTGNASDRVARAGLAPRLLLENIGRDYGASQVHEGLMASPGHRANILNPAVRHVGIGVVMQREQDRVAFLVTELFADFGR
jgi:uncharacterized protein YkwD